MSSAAELFRLITNLIRTGTVFDVDLSARPALVRIRDGQWESGWLQWAAARAGTTKTWNPPTRSETVLAVCPGGDTVAGYVIMSLNTDANPAPSDQPNIHQTDYPDGAQVIYDHQAGLLTITGIHTLAVDASTLIEFTCPQTTFKGKVTIEDLLSYQAGMSGKNSKGNKTSITGDFVQTDGEMSSNGVVVDKHDHGGVQRGGSRTDGPT